TLSAASVDQAASVDTISDEDEGNDGAGKKSEKRKKGRPAGSKTKAQDLKLYLDWKPANHETGMTKQEFLRARGLPMSDLAAIERGRKQPRERMGLEKTVGNISVKV